MYICICNALCEKTIQSALGDQLHTADYEAIYARLGCKPQCGRCEDAFVDFVETLRQTRRNVPFVAGHDSATQNSTK